MPSEKINYKFNEQELLEELATYITKTYTEHYTKGNANAPQSFEVISKDPVRGLHFSVGSIQKYSDRFGSKDDERKELLKIAHYAILSLYCLDKKLKDDR